MCLSTRTIVPDLSHWHPEKCDTSKVQSAGNQSAGNLYIKFGGKGEGMLSKQWLFND